MNGEGDRRGGSGEVGHGRVDRRRRVARGNEFGIGRVSVEGGLLGMVEESRRVGQELGYQIWDGREEWERALITIPMYATQFEN